MIIALSFDTSTNKTKYDVQLIQIKTDFFSMHYNFMGSLLQQCMSFRYGIALHSIKGFVELALQI